MGGAHTHAVWYRCTDTFSEETATGYNKIDYFKKEAVRIIIIILTAFIINYL